MARAGHWVPRIEGTAAEVRPGRAVTQVEQSAAPSPSSRRRGQAGQLVQRESRKASSLPVSGKKQAAAEARADWSTSQEARLIGLAKLWPHRPQEARCDRGRWPWLHNFLFRELLFRRATMLRARHRAGFTDEMQDFLKRRAAELRARHMAEFAVQMQEYQNSLGQNFR